MTSLQANSSPQALAVIALGGNALSPASGDLSYRTEREVVSNTCAELAQLAGRGFRLLIVHGNGPQVGRLMRNDLAGDSLDIHVAQTQGELGYLLTQGLQMHSGLVSASIMTRTVVDDQDPALKRPEKAVGPILAKRPDAPHVETGDGWRVVVGSPKPQSVVELAAIKTLLQSCHVVAGGGGGVAVTKTGSAVQGVVDKDHVAAHLAIALDAAHLIFVTSVAGVYKRYGRPDSKLITALSTSDAETLLSSDTLGAGTMAPKMVSATAYAKACGRQACIVGLGDIVAGLDNQAGTRIYPVSS